MNIILKENVVMVKDPVSNALSVEWIVINKKILLQYTYITLTLHLHYTYNTITILLHFFCLIIKCGHIVSLIICCSCILPLFVSSHMQFDIYVCQFIDASDATSNQADISSHISFELYSIHYLPSFTTHTTGSFVC